MIQAQNSTEERERYFHTCWLTMKAQRPDLLEFMTHIELSVAGMESLIPEPQPRVILESDEHGESEEADRPEPPGDIQVL